ncbi:beta-galactosidase [Isoptericola sp. BMS4]|uniref:glycoside hydrolase family 35 protein n=1 Tax=Isoptericola sp. BMS4 TaxID=2527875 RepID=UPI00141EA75E|nr:beta-galactosidase [Isoptericola sp. BMS4]
MTTTPTLTTRGTALLRRGAPHRILSGSVHYFRVHPDLWRDRLARVRAMGLNTVDTYVPWNWHEPERGGADFTGARDLEAFVRLVGDLGMDMVMRPGPYICAEWDNGGLPVWLTARAGAGGLALRTGDPAFTDEVARWFDDLVPRLAALQANRGGPIVAVQVENEYGSYGEDHDYMAWVAGALRDRGIDELLFTSDGPTALMQDGGSLPGVLAAATFGSKPGQARDLLAARRPGGEPFLCAEFWNGWFDHWGEAHHTRDAHDAARSVGELLEIGGSVSLYMAHGGTNTGLTAGANHDGSRLQPTVTSYDSDAPVAEDGTATAKFFALRDVFAPYRSAHLPGDALDDAWIAPPERLPARTLGPAATRPLLPALRAVAGPGERAPRPRTFEQLGLAAGLVLYRATTRLPVGTSVVSVLGLHDRATVQVDGVPVGVLERESAHEGLAVTGTGDEVVLELVVEHLGRVNYGPRLGEHKGVVGDVLVDRRIVHGWHSAPVPLDRLDPDALWDAGADAAPDGAGLLARTTFHVDEPADTFLALPGWAKGFAWVNDVLLGRYWEVGPQRTLYVPAPLLRSGDNTVTVLEQHRAGTGLELRPGPELGEAEEYVEEF